MSELTGPTHINADAFVHGLLHPIDEAHAKEHCETCLACKLAVEEARKRLALLRATPPTEAPPALIDATLRHIDETTKRRARRNKWTLAVAFGTAAAAVLVLASLHVYTERMQPSPYDLVVLGQRDLLAGTSASLRVRLVDHNTNTPIAGVPVTVELLGDAPVQLDRFTTDAQGSGEPKLVLPDADGEYTLRVRADTPQGEEVVSRTVRLHRAWKVMVTTDKPVYQPGQTIHARTLALRSLDQKPAKELPALFTLSDPKGNLIFKQTGETSKFGIAAMDCRLAGEILEGRYVLSCKVGETETRQAVEVKKYVLPKFKVEVRLDRPYYRPKETAKVVVQADYFFGKPVADAEVVVNVAEGDGESKHQLQEKKLRTDDKGRAEFDYALADMPSAPTVLSFDAAVVDVGGEKQSVTVERLVARDAVRIDLVPENGTLVPEVPNTVYVLTTRLDGLPMSLRVKVGNFDEIRTDALGVGSFVVVPSASFVEEVKARDDMGELLASRTARLDCINRTSDFLLRTDKAAYRAGDTMLLSVRAATDSPVYVDIVKDGQTLTTRTIDVRLGMGSASIDIPPELFGTLQLCAYRFASNYHVVERTRVVYVQSGELKIETMLDRDEYRPRGSANIHFRVTDAKGRAAPGALSVAAVDEAVFSVLTQRPGLDTHFYTVNDNLLAPAYQLRPWSPSASSRDDEAQQRLQQALFSATAAIETQDVTRPSRYDHDRRRSMSHSLGGESYDGKVIDFEKLRDDRLAWIRRGWWGLVGIIAFAAYISLFFLVPDFKTLIHIHFIAFLFLGPIAVFATMSLGAKTNNTFSYVGTQVGKVSGGGASTPQRGGLEEPDQFATRIDLPRNRDHAFVQAGEFVFDVYGGADAPRVRDYFPETLAWRPHLITDDDGRAAFDLTLADSITTWRLSASAVDAGGRLGAVEKPLKVFQPFFVDVNLPVSLTRGDEIAVPVVVHNYLKGPQTVRLSLAKEPWFLLLDDDPEKSVELAAGQARAVSYRLRVEKAGERTLTVSAHAGDIRDAVKRPVEVVPDGRRVEVVHNGTLDPDAAHELALPKDAIDGSGRALVKIYPSGFSEVVEGLDGIFRLPHGCFEQTSSTTYPNVLALDYLKRTKEPSAAVEAKAKEYIHLGYQRLLSFEVRGGGFSLFGQAPADVKLTAYGLMEFTDMARVHTVDAELLARTRDWLLKQRADDGSWGNLRQTAYVAWAVFGGGQSAEQRDRTRKFLLRERPERLNDPYLLALVCNALLAIDPSGKDAAPYVDRLESLKRPEADGQRASWAPVGDDGTLYFAKGETAAVDTTALAALVFQQTKTHSTSMRQALAWLAAHKDADGTWRSTQATVLALKALLGGTTAGGDKERRFVVRLGDKFEEEIVVPPVQADVLQTLDLSKYLTAEPQRLTIRETTGTKAAYQVTFRYNEPLTRTRPEDTPLSIAMKFGGDTAKVGETMTATATATNRTGKAAPMVMLELPVPVGFALSGEDFDSLVEKKTIAKYERTSRGVLVYLTELDRELVVTYHLRATTPARGTTTPARVYEYYNSQQEGRSEQAVLVVKE
jgi:hypothetical protein